MPTVTAGRTSREIHLVSRPHGHPTPDDFALIETTVAEPGVGDLLVRNLYMSVDPYMRGRMNDVPSYVPPFALDHVMQGGALGEVVETASPDFEVGQTVVHNYGWRDLAVVPSTEARRIEPGTAPLPCYLGILGMPGFTAWIGLTEMAQVHDSDVVFVSGAAGAVGSAAGQMARLMGASRVIGSAGSDEKVALLTGELGFDAAFNYRSGPVHELLAAAAPQGIDVYFDNVGGSHLEAAIDTLRPHGRIAACGSISGYNATEAPPGPRNLRFIVGKRLSVRGFIVSDHDPAATDFVATVADWLARGEIHAPQSITDGLEHAADAFIGMLGGANVGKALVRIAEPGDG